ncbi:MAG: hypothetical protein JRG74_15650 [Deltaproteobacteria bacterium]|nr:hypothetical protein [Deltaproteobacteria bacterium]MBW2742384.1 hypothetical protein [Deltaproteobacteria bacterium]
MVQTYPKVWDWVKEDMPRRLSGYVRAPDKIGFYELGFMKNGTFEAQYAGRAKGVTLRQRLGQHYRNSHNENVRKNRDHLYFRCKVFKTEELSSYVEAVSIAAIEYPWNRRNEWAQHWILES